MQLADTSAWVWTRAAGGQLRAAFDEAVVSGEVATCAMVRLIAAAAEAAEVELLHYDEDYDRIAAVTGQATRWLAPRGSLR